jgi:transcriptional antiterminator NusG
MSWYVLHVRTGREPEIKAELKRKGYAAAVPTELRTERQGGVWRERERIVIPGYVFLKICLTDQDYYRVRGIPNVIRFWGSGRPEALREDEESYFTWLANEDARWQPSAS